MASTDPSPAAPIPATPPSARRCENCGVPLQGDHCHACGQPTKGLVRHFSSILGDFFDTVLNIDSRVLRTLGPLLTRPGFLSMEYFAGRRVRYVTPMRLFLFLTLLAFFAIQGSIDFNDPEPGVSVSEPGKNVDARSAEIEAATTVAQVEAARAGVLKQLADARKNLDDVPGGAAGIAGIEMAEESIREAADERIAYLKLAEANRKAGKPPPPAPSMQGRNKGFSFNANGKPWDPVTNPIAFGWLPQPVNQNLNKRVAHASDVLKASNSEKPVVEALFNVLPQTLIVLMPLFALMLKLIYWFKRRLFMEHLIVALHSHAFIALALTLVLTFSWLQDWLTPNPGFWQGVFGWGMGLSAAWIPVYLLLMQKRVYGQGWPMTLVKFCVLGLCYSILLGFGLAAAMLIGLLTL
ncbi:MAG: DUF3667 domain-containing protein [Gammaproteobacteria bacterium]|nr:DUF3667 domain-containing protein [Gammaproteobacteria bacterium]